MSKPQCIYNIHHCIQTIPSTGKTRELMISANNCKYKEIKEALPIAINHDCLRVEYTGYKINRYIYSYIACV